MHKEDAVHIYNGILLSYQKEWNNAICSNMDSTRDFHTRWRKSEREKQMPYDITYMWNLYEPISETESWDRKQTYGFQGGEGLGRDGLGMGFADVSCYIQDG